MGMLSQLLFEPAAGQTRGWRYAMSNEPSWRAAQVVEPVRIGGLAVERLGVTRRIARRGTRLTVMLSVVGHVMALVAVALLVQSRADDAGNEPTAVQLVFVPGPVAAPVGSQTAVAAPVVVPPERQAIVPATAVTVPPPSLAEIATPLTVPQSVATAEPDAVALPVPPLPPAEPPAPAKPHLVARPTPERMIVAQQSTAQPTTQSMIAGSVSFGAAAQIIPPRPVAGMDTNRAPVYPELARRRGEQGRVLLRVNVSTDGTPLEVAGYWGYAGFTDT